MGGPHPRGRGQGHPQNRPHAGKPRLRPPGQPPRLREARQGGVAEDETGMQ